VQNNYKLFSFQIHTIHTQLNPEEIKQLGKILVDAFVQQLPKMELTVVGQSLNRSSRFCIASALSISIKTIAGKSLKENGFSRVETCIEPWLMSF